MFTGDVAVFGTDGEGRAQGEIGEMEVLGDAPHQQARAGPVLDALPEKAVKDGAAGVAGLQAVLMGQGGEDVLRRPHRQLGRVGVVGLLGAGGDDAGIALAVALGQAEAGPLGRGRFQIVEVAAALLELFEAVAHEFEGLLGQRRPGRGFDPLAEEVEGGLVHADQADGGEVVVPEAAAALADGAEVEAAVGVEAIVGEALELLALDLEGGEAELHQLGDAAEELFFRRGDEGGAGEIEGDDADGAGQRIGAEKTAAAPAQFAVVETQAAAHGAGVLGVHVGVDEVGKVGDAVLGGHLPDRLQARVVPVEVAGDVVGRDGEGEDAAGSIAGHHHFAEGAVEKIHLRLEVAVAGLLQRAADDHRLTRHVARADEVHGDVGEGGLEADAGRHVHAEDELLHRLLDLGEAEAIVADEGGEQGVEAGEGLGPGRLPLEGVEEVDRLPQGGAEVLGRGALDLAEGAGEAFEEEVFEVPAAAVDREHAEIVDVIVAVAMGLGDGTGIEFLQPVVAGDVGGDVVVEALQGVTHVGVLVDPPVFLGEVGVDGGDRLAHELAGAAQRLVLFAVEDVLLGGLGVAVFDEDLFDQILDVFDGGDAAVLVENIEDADNLAGDNGRPLEIAAADRFDGETDRRGDLGLFEGDQTAVTLADLLGHSILLT